MNLTLLFPDAGGFPSSTNRMTGRILALIIATGFSAAVAARADHVVMQNGDQYFGKVVSLTTNSLSFQSETLGNVTLPRAKVKSVTLGTNAPVKPAPLIQQPSASIQSHTAVRNGATDLSVAFRGIQADSNLIQQVQAEYLSAASPEANQKFNETLSGLATGKLNLNDLRGEAKSAADQLRAFKRELGEEAGDGLDQYLEILDRFLRETETAGTAVKSGSSNNPAIGRASNKK